MRFIIADPTISHSRNNIATHLKNERPVLPLEAEATEGKLTIVVIDIDGADSFAFVGDKLVFDAKAKAIVRPG